MKNAPTASTQILVDQAILVSMQNENKTLHQLVIEFQASNVQLQSQLLDIQVSNINTNNTIVNKNLNNTNEHEITGQSSEAIARPTEKRNKETDNNIIKPIPKIYKPPTITVFGVNDLQNFATILNHEEVPGNDQQLKNFANGDITPILCLDSRFSLICFCFPRAFENYCEF